MIIPAPLYQGQPGTTNATLWTVPSVYQNHSVQQAVVKQILLCNTTASAATVTLYLVPSGSAAGNTTAIASALSVAANDTKILNLGQVILPAAGASLQGLQGTTGAITVTASGFYHA